MADGADITDRNPFLFVVGCQRSGTTLLQRMLDHHPALAVGYDSHFIPRPIKRLPVGVDPVLTPEIVEEVRTFHRFSRLGLSASDVDRAAEAATYGGFVSAVYDAYARRHGKPLAGEKSPGYCRHLPALHALFPWAKIVHLIRDGRDVTLSILDWKKGPAKLDLFREEPVATCALWWLRDLRLGRRDGAALGPDLYHEVSYERLCAAPEPALRAMTAFLGLPFDEAMVTYHQGKTRLEPGKSAKASWLPATSGLRDWRTQMSAADVEIFEAVAGDVLGELGYRRGVAEPSREATDRAERCRAWWDEHVEGKKRGGPRAAVPRRRAAAKRPTNPFVFIVGCPRSGTTLLKRIVDAHPKLAITPETHWIPRCHRKGLGVTRDGRTTPELLEYLFGYRKFGNLKLDPKDVEALAAGDDVAYADFVSGIFDLFAARAGKPFAGDKTPGYVQDMPLLHRLWPHAKFVHIVRDGRDVWLSMRDWDRAERTAGRYATWDDDPVTTTALWWERFVRLGRESGRVLGSARYHELSYEALVAEPEQACRSLSAFLGLPYDAAMVSFADGRTRDDPDMSAKRAWRPVTAGLRDWRTQISPDDLVRFEAVAGDLLDELGLERGAPPPSPDALDHAATFRDRFTKDPHFKERLLPAGWMPSCA